MDDVSRPGRENDPVREAEVALDEIDVEAVEEVEIGGFADEGVDLPAPAAEPAAEVGADKAVGARDEDAAQGKSPKAGAGRPFQARSMSGATRMTRIPAAMPMTMSDR